MTMTSLNATGLRSDPVSVHLWDVVENKIYIMDVNRQVCKICQECFQDFEESVPVLKTK